MHASDLAFIAPLTMSIVALWAAGIWLMLWRQARRGYMLPTAAAWLGLCAYFALLAISAGETPVFARGDIAPVVRSLLLGVAALVGISKTLLLVVWRRDST